MSSRLIIGCIDVEVREDELVMFKPKTQGSLLTLSEVKLLADFLIVASNPRIHLMPKLQASEKSNVKGKKKNK